MGAMTNAEPLIRGDRLDAIVGVDQTGRVTLDRFLRDVAGLAGLLPPHRHVINLCRDRYHFAVALGAALMRSQISLMPPSDAVGTLGDLAAEFHDVYCIYDEAMPRVDVPSLAYPERVAATQPPTMPHFPADQPAVVLFTSGSTGRPTPHAKSWGCLVRSALSAGGALGIGRVPGAAIIGTVPQQHSYGFESTVMLALQHGLALHHARPFYPADIVAAVAATPAPRILVTTPIHLRAVLADSGRMPNVDLIVSATAPLARDLADEAEKCFAAPLIEIYGCSEAGQLATRRTTASEEWQCLEGVALRQDATGSWVSGAPIAGEVRLADVIEITAPGRFRLRGRTADLVNIAGKRSSLAHLNYHLNAIPGVIDGVFVAPDGASENARLTAFVVAPGLSAESILTALRQRLDPAFLPRPLRLVDALPRNALGKLPQAALTQLKNVKAG
jgi:acyl-coenzyme A synthetase/AMP-(fatty) acid ligase